MKSDTCTRLSWGVVTTVSVSTLVVLGDKCKPLSHSILHVADFMAPVTGSRRSRNLASTKRIKKSMYLLASRLKVVLK